MKKLSLNICKICGKTLTSRGFSFHISQTHNLFIEDYILKYEFNNNPPVCKCGCGEKVTIRGYQIMDYVDGHSPAGRFVAGEFRVKNREEWKKNLGEGIRKYNNEAKLKNFLYRKGINNNFYGKHHSVKTKELLREKVEQQIKKGKHAFLGNDNGRIGTSSLEKKFENYLISKKIIYKNSYRVPFIPEGKKSIRYKYYDFYIPLINTLVEIHGSYWHPQNIENLTSIQESNLKNDKLKNKIAKDNLYYILTIYDYELDNFIENDELFNIINLLKDKKNDLISIDRVTESNVIELPEYWTKLVDPNSITVQLTPIGSVQNLFVEKIEDNKVYVKSQKSLLKLLQPIDCYYVVFAERSDVEKLQVEI